MSALRPFVEEVVAPCAAQLDTDTGLLQSVWAEFVARGLHRFEGLDLFSGAGELAEHSGALAFLALQQQVAGCPDPPAGVAFGHLRNPAGAAPLWRAGRVSGPVPWLTGAGIFPRLLLGFRLEDGREARAWIEAADRPRFRHGPPLPLIALASTRTVSATLCELALDEGDFVRVDAPGTMAEGDRKGALGQTPLLLGNCRASVRLIEASGRGDASAARERLSALEDRIALARASGEATEGRRLRAALGEWAVRLARLASLSCGGASLLEGHPAGRLYREALVFNLMAQTDDIVADAFKESFP